jgi:hypothetical protein
MTNPTQNESAPKATQTPQAQPELPAPHTSGLWVAAIMIGLILLIVALEMFRS